MCSAAGSFGASFSTGAALSGEVEVEAEEGPTIMLRLRFSFAAEDDGDTPAIVARLLKRSWVALAGGERRDHERGLSGGRYEMDDCLRLACFRCGALKLATDAEEEDGVFGKCSGRGAGEPSAVDVEILSGRRTLVIVADGGGEGTKSREDCNTSLSLALLRIHTRR